MLAAAAEHAQELITETPFPEELCEEILEAYREVDNGDAFVAV